MPVTNPVLDYLWSPKEAGLQCASTDPSQMASAAIMTVAGTLVVIRQKVPTTILATNVIMACSVAGATLTAGQCFAGVYLGTTLIASTADQATNWQTNGEKEMALVGGPYTIAPTDTVWVGLFANGSTLPTWRTMSAPTSSINVKGFIRAGAGNAGLTTAMPATLTGPSSTGQAFWAGIS